MKSNVVVHTRVRDFVKALPPEPRKKLRNAIRGLAHHKGDIKPLQGALAGTYRLRAGAYGVIFSTQMQEGKRVVICHYAQHRSIVYEVLEAKETLKKLLVKKEDEEFNH